MPAIAPGSGAISTLRNDMTEAIGALRVEMKDSLAALRRDRSAQIGWLIGTAITAVGAAFTAAKFFSTHQACVTYGNADMQERTAHQHFDCLG